MIVVGYEYDVKTVNIHLAIVDCFLCSPFIKSNCTPVVQRGGYSSVG